MTYEAQIEELIADLRLDVCEALQDGRADDWKARAEVVHNAADFMQHQLMVLKMMRGILNEAGGGEDGRAKQLLRALDKVLAAAPSLRTEQADIMAAVARGELA